MALKYGIFESEFAGLDTNNMPIYDRAVDEEFLEQYIGGLFTNGIGLFISNCFQVISELGNKITVNPGMAIINGKMAYDKSSYTVSLPASPTTYNRYDRVVLRRENLNRDFVIAFISGTENAAPVVPALTRTENTYELSLATILRSPSDVVTQAKITDDRLSTSLCGAIAPKFEPLAADDLFAQFTAVFNEWFNGTRELLTSDVAGNLLSMINDLISNVGEISGLSTAEKSNLVGAINELVTGIADIESDLSVHTTAISNNAQEINNHTGSTTIHVTSGEKTSWNGKIDKSLITAPGDLIYGSAANTPAKLAKGTDNQVLKITSGLPSWGSNGNDINYELLGTITTTAGQASIEFTNIPTSYDYLMIKCTEILSNDSSGDGLKVIFNNDPAGNILGMGVWSRNGSISSWTSDANFAYLRIYGIVSPSPSMQKGSFDLEVKQLDSAKFKEFTLSNGLYKEYPAQPLGSFFCGGGWWMNQVSKVTNVKFAPENTTRFAAGCTFKLYGGKLNG